MKKISEKVKLDRFYSYVKYNNLKLFGSENALYYEANDTLLPYPLNTSFHYRIMDMKVRDSMLVVATTEKGIFFIKDHTVIRNLNESNGLSSNNCSKVVYHGDELFIATNNGICRYQYASNKMEKIMESDGLASNNVLDITFDRDTLYAGTDNGLSIIPLQGLSYRNTFHYFISPVMQSNGDTLWDNIRSVPSRTNRKINLTLNAITLGVKGNVRYFYRIRELDSTFAVTTDPNISFAIKSPGDYTFESYSLDANGLKSETALLSLNIIPYWYQTTTFVVSCVVLIVMSLILLALLLSWYIKERERKRNELANRIKKLEMDAWKANVNPHFLFNSFNTMQSLFTTNQFEKANEFIASFSTVLRKTIDNSSRLMNPIPDEVAYLKNYLELEKVKRNHQLTYTITVHQEEINQYFIPSLLLQPIVENSIKHGIKQLRDGEIHIDFFLKNNKLECVLLDNGIGFPPETANPGNSKGLEIVKDKIRIVENVAGATISFDIGNVYNETGQVAGVKALFLMPLFNGSQFD